LVAFIFCLVDQDKEEEKLVVATFVIQIETGYQQNLIKMKHNLIGLLINLVNLKIDQMKLFFITIFLLFPFIIPCYHLNLNFIKNILVIVHFFYRTPSFYTTVFLPDIIMP